MDELYAAAKKEGPGRVRRRHQGGARAASSPPPSTKRYPGIAVKYTRRSTEPMVQLIEAERRANRVSFDLLNLTEPGDVVRWTRRRISLPPVPIPDTDKMLPETFDPNGFYVAISVTPMLGIYNTKVLKPSEAPKSLKALVTDPKWKGKVAISRPTARRHGSGALMNVVDAVGRDFLKNARDRDILLTLGNEAAINAVVSGERPVSWGVSGYRAIEARADGSPIELIVWDEGVALAQFIGVVPAKAPHPNAGAAVLPLADDAGRPGTAGHATPTSIRPRKDVDGRRRSSSRRCRR